MCEIVLHGLVLTNITCPNQPFTFGVVLGELLDPARTAAVTTRVSRPGQTQDAVDDQAGDDRRRHALKSRILFDPRKDCVVCRTECLDEQVQKIVLGIAIGLAKVPAGRQGIRQRHQNVPPPHGTRHVAAGKTTDAVENQKRRR